MAVILETPRLILREFELHDASDVFEFGSNKTVQKYTGDPLIGSVEEARELIKNVWFKDYGTYGYGRFATIYKPENKLIGFAGLKYLPEMDETDIGFRFLPEYWGKGLATEASQEIIRYGFNQLKLNRILGIAMDDNLASCKVLTKIGLEFYKRDDYLGDGTPVNWYQIDRSSFEQSDIYPSSK